MNDVSSRETESKWLPVLYKIRNHRSIIKKVTGNFQDINMLFQFLTEDTIMLKSMNKNNWNNFSSASQVRLHIVNLEKKNVTIIRNQYAVTQNEKSLIHSYYSKQWLVIQKRAINLESTDFIAWFHKFSSVIYNKMRKDCTGFWVVL